MSKFIFQFQGRKREAIGLSEEMAHEYEGDTQSEAEEKMRADYEVMYLIQTFPVPD